jgi:hypothetical protein
MKKNKIILFTFCVLIGCFLAMCFKKYILQDIDDFREISIYANEALINSRKNSNVQQQIIDDLRWLGYDLLEKSYYKGDHYNYAYNADGFEELLYYALQYEIWHLSRSDIISKDKHIAEVLEKHFKAYISAISELDLQDESSKKRRIQRLSLLLKDYKSLDEIRYSNILESYHENYYLLNSVKLINSLNEKTKTVDERGSDKSVSIARDKYLRARNK